MSLLKEIEALIQPIVDEKGSFIVDLVLRGDKCNTMVEIFLDTAEGITTSQCAEISREIAKEFDRTDLIKGSYHLVVSSPGADRPIKDRRQYARHIGKKFTVQIRSDGGMVTVTGTLVEMLDDGLAFEINKGERRVMKFSEIESSRICLPW